MTDLRKVLSIKEAGQVLGCSRNVIYDMIRDGRLQTITVGELPKITMASIDRFIDDQLMPPRRRRGA